jgi:ATP-dependent RNA helicase HelY
LLAPPHKLPPFGQILNVLKKYRLLPAIFFLKSRADCDNALELCQDHVIYDERRKELLKNRIQEIAEDSPHILSHRQLDDLEIWLSGLITAVSFQTGNC